MALYSLTSLRSRRAARTFVHRLSFARGDPWTPAPLQRRQGDAPLSLTLSGPSAGARVIVPHSPLHPPARRGLFATPPAPLGRLRRADTTTPRILRDARRWRVCGEHSAPENLSPTLTNGGSWLSARAPAARNLPHHPDQTRPSRGKNSRLRLGAVFAKSCSPPCSARTSAMRSGRTVQGKRMVEGSVVRPALRRHSGSLALRRSR